MIPPRNVLAAIDFSDASRASLHCAARLAHRWGASLHVVYVLDALLAAAAQARHLDVMSGARDELDDFCRSAQLGDVVPALHVVVGSPAEAICEIADAMDAQLIVGGSRGRSGLNRVMMGATIEHVIRRARVSVLTVPGRCPPDGVTEWGPVIAALADPDRPDPVAQGAAVLATSLDAPLHVVHVVPPLPALARWRAETDAAHDALIDTAQHKLAIALRGLDGLEPANVHVARGTVPDALAAELGRHTRSLPVLVLGRAAPGHGHAPGTIASRVIARATGAVWLYLPDAERVRPAAGLDRSKKGS